MIMRAIIWTRYGPPEVLVPGEVKKPEPKDDEVLIRVYASSAFAGDCELRRLHIAPSIRPFLRLYIGLFRPKRIMVLGQEMAGVVESVGKSVTRFKPGDKVFGISGMRFGTYAEYVCIHQGQPLAIKPDGMTYEEAAVTSVGGMEALHFFHRANLRKGDKVLINGAGGSIGTLALQMAKMAGAEVTCVDTEVKLNMLRELGADRTVDHTHEDFSNSGGTYDIIFDVVGNLTYSRAMGSLRTGGTLILGNSGFVISRSRGIRALLTRKGTVLSNLQDGTTGDLEELKKLISAGKIRIIIDRRFPLEKAADAHRYIESGQKMGNVVLIVIEETPDK